MMNSTSNLALCIEDDKMWPVYRDGKNRPKRTYIEMGFAKRFEELAESCMYTRYGVRLPVVDRKVQPELYDKIYNHVCDIWRQALEKYKEKLTTSFVKDNGWADENFRLDQSIEGLQYGTNGSLQAQLDSYIYE